MTCMACYYNYSAFVAKIISTTYTCYYNYMKTFVTIIICNVIVL